MDFLLTHRDLGSRQRPKPLDLHCELVYADPQGFLVWLDLEPRGVTANVYYPCMGDELLSHLTESPDPRAVGYPTLWNAVHAIADYKAHVLEQVIQATQAMHLTVTTLHNLYTDNSWLNSVQPEDASAIYAGSLDEWDGSIAQVVEDWRQVKP